jgi:L-rhamnose mutarotase
MEQIVFKMKLKHGFETEYRRRHAEIWPELISVLKESGITQYEIFFDQETDTLIAVQYKDENANLNLPDNELMRKWWHYMSDLMETNPDESPVVVRLEKVFSMFI